MTVLKKRSTILTVVLFCLLILIGSNGLYTMYITHTIKADAEIINKLGIIRGSIQRSTQLELNGIQDDLLIGNINTIISDFQNNKYRVYDKNDELLLYLTQLEETWISLSEAMYTYRTNPTSTNSSIIIELSELAWVRSNNLVYIYQQTSQNKVAKLDNSFFMLTINLIFGIFIIYLIKKYVKDTLEYLVNYDDLTGIFNRRFFNEYLLKEIEKFNRYPSKLSLVILDIDRFKNVNDTYGHDVGDIILKDLAKLVNSNIRKSDILARIGGEEFAIVLTNCDINDGFSFAEKIRNIVSQHNFHQVGQITISLGVTQLHENDTTDTIYKRADNALYIAKKNGRNRSEIEIKNGFIMTHPNKDIKIKQNLPS
ncbi:GGDEF domain-containing protein [Serpentinicella alkaliphila]|uniref:Diguanylate cyclase (GGDEF)-like protein n=2 Tax=Serpentinicella alkaliphila TaxID=1734049 RepID=A0A4R2TNL3_9FIRM|nr:GGDEF domain-containing protein [Serpentinicella alkaliphila]TCP98988.1 diguanylate cyclase (GGDEF)-like protein [Serpentinicella alkaliphila]